MCTDLPVGSLGTVAWNLEKLACTALAAFDELDDDVCWTALTPARAMFIDPVAGLDALVSDLT